MSFSVGTVPLSQRLAAEVRGGPDGGSVVYVTEEGRLRMTLSVTCPCCALVDFNAASQPLDTITDEEARALVGLLRRGGQGRGVEFHARSYPTGAARGVVAALQAAAGGVLGNRGSGSGFVGGRLRDPDESLRRMEMDERHRAQREQRRIDADIAKEERKEKRDIDREKRAEEKEERRLRLQEASDERKRKKDEEKERKKPRQCFGVTLGGKRCQRMVRGSDYCWEHKDQQGGVRGVMGAVGTWVRNKVSGRHRPLELRAVPRPPGPVDNQGGGREGGNQQRKVQMLQRRVGALRR